MKHPPGPKDIELRLITGLMEKGYKLTPQRREIISVLSNDMAHPGAMDILKKGEEKSAADKPVDGVLHSKYL